jgi:chromosome segregation ATPase
MAAGQDMVMQVQQLTKLVVGMHPRVAQLTGEARNYASKAGELAVQSQNISDLVASLQESLEKYQTATQIAQLQQQLESQSLLHDEQSSSIQELKRNLGVVQQRAHRRASLRKQLQEQRSKQRAAIERLESRLGTTS